MQVSRISVPNQFSVSKNQKTQMQNQPNFGHFSNEAIIREAVHVVDELHSMGIRDVAKYREAMREARQITNRLLPDISTDNLFQILRERVAAFTNRGLDVPAEYVPGL